MRHTNVLKLKIECRLGWKNADGKENVSTYVAELSTGIELQVGEKWRLEAEAKREAHLINCQLCSDVKWIVPSVIARVERNCSLQQEIW